MKNRMFKTISILTLVIYIVINALMISNTYAVYSETYSANKISSYPGYQELIEAMKAKHPNWNFTILYTGLNWNDVINHETTLKHGRNVVPSSWSAPWKCAEHVNTPMGGSSWRCASVQAVEYYMDPRNWINDSYIFQFETLSFNGNIQTVEGVQKIIASVKYMQGNTVTYTKTDGTKATINKSYAQLIYDAAKAANISPYHLAARVKQEQGAGSTPGSTATGTYPGYVGYYNFMNIGASGDTDGQVIANGLTYAKNSGWTDPEISIREGAKSLAKSYISLGQDTLYLQKFDVDSSDGDLYWHQYMQNVAVCISEGSSVRSTYESLGLLGSAIDFKIPVYEGMPSMPCSEPNSAATAPTLVTQNVQIKGTSVRIRTGASTTSDIITTQDNGYNLLRIEIAKTPVAGLYWDKVVLSDGRKGYVAHQYLNQVADITNCNETVTITGSGVYLRNGPGTIGTSIVTTLNKGQLVTRIEKGKYDVDGYIWDRIRLSNGTQGYIAQKYLSIVLTAENSIKLETTNLVCVPATTVELIKTKYTDAVIKNASGTVITTGNVGTGYKITTAGKEYTIVKYGDATGDGEINSADLLRIQKHLLNVKKITDVDFKKAADPTKDGEINSADLLKIQKHLLNVSQISL